MAIGSIFSLARSFDPHHRQGGARSRAVLTACSQQAQSTNGKGTPAMDLIVLGIGILFFALSLAYVKACDRI
jgi:hypothetical protein